MLFSRISLVSIPTVLVLLLSCGGGGGGSSQAPTTTPTGLSAVQGSYFDSVKLTWTPPSDPGDGYEVEGKSGSGSFSKLHSGLLNPTLTSANTNLNSDVPELTDFLFRMRSIKGTVASAYSNEAPYRRGLKPPSAVYANFYDSSVNVSWWNDSLIADGIRLERAEVSISGATGSYSTIGTYPVSVTKYLDLDLVEGKSYKYRVTFTKGTDESPKVESSSVAIAALGPLNLSVESRVESLKLTWSNRSSNATALKVMRASGVNSSSFSVAATLPSTASEFVDAPLASGYYSYRVDAITPSLTMGSAIAYGVTLPTGSGPAFVPAILNLPTGSTLARDGQGNWFAAREGYQDYTLLVPKAGSWEPHTLAQADAYASPAMLLDPGGHPHSLYLRPTIQGSQERAIIHEWHDGTVWKSEEVARRVVNYSSSNSGIQWGISPQGVLHVAWQLDYLNTNVEYATNLGGSWSITTVTLSATPQSNFGFMRLAVARDETPIIALAYWDKLYLRSKPLGMAWREELVPTGLINGGWHGLLSILAKDADNFSLFYERNGSNPTDAIMHLARTSSGWSTPETVVTSSNYYAFAGMTAAGSSDGTKMFVALSLSSVQLLIYRDPSLGWQTTTLGPSTYGGKSFPGFTPAGKAYILVPVGYEDYSTKMQIYGMYTQAP